MIERENGCWNCQRFIITVSGEYLDTRTNKFYSIKEIFDLLNYQDQRIDTLQGRLLSCRNANSRAYNFFECLERAVDECANDEILEKIWEKYAEYETEVALND